MEERVIYKCFISSPGDCGEERNITEKVIGKLNKGIAKHLKINFETFKWENDVLPDMGKNGQEIIDDSVEKSNYDIFIGIMRYRFGTPTKIAGSGTEHEYIKALEKKSNNSLPKIVFFFNNENVNPKELDFIQYNKVQEFKKKIGTNGLYIDYEGVIEFKKELERVLELFIKGLSTKFQSKEVVETIDRIRVKLDDDLKKSLKSFNEDAPIWIEPIISKSNNISKNPTKNIENNIDLSEILNNTKNLIIKAPSEFGLTSLAHYLKLEAWKIGKTFVYIDSKLTKKHKIVKNIEQIITNDYLKNRENIDCIIIDSICFEESGTLKMIKNVSDNFKEIPIIILNTIGNDLFLTTNEDEDDVKINRSFLTYYLLSLPQSEIRKIVNQYIINNSFNEDNDILLDKVTNDLEVLNIHRTAKNCLAILKASSKIGVEHSSVNRTKLLDTILSIIFEEYDIPTYKSKKPDIKDCTYVLGFFCELLLKRNDFEFSEDYFKRELQDFCEENYIDLDLDYLFQVLIDNAIFAKRIDLYFFKNVYWVFYFIAHRMNLNLTFKEDIYKEKRYIDFPEIMEFYSGIDRNKEDALKVLKDDIRETLESVKDKVKIPGNLNPYNSISWEPNVESLEKEEEKISKNVISSGLPDELKDKYNDKHYDQVRPYNQVINSVMKDYSFKVLMRQITASSRVLRNSDFVDSNLKKEFLDDILRGWNEVSKLLIILTPILADKGNAAFEGARFELNDDDFNISNKEEKRLRVLLSVPTNVVSFFKNDLFSNKMGPLICSKAINESNSLLKHELMLLIANERPKNWNIIIDKYIVELDKNSFFLSDIATTLKVQFNYNVTEVKDRRILGNLMHKCRAKHYFKTNNPDLKLINRARKDNRSKHF
ncbi:hypothetical protein [Polaribacter staleyi]|uniref:hypothetical protein n=1 Tax=Polaribacter staleyi TaxID=2022337 RepID=UPI0031BA6DBF